MAKTQIDLSTDEDEDEKEFRIKYGDSLKNSKKKSYTVIFNIFQVIFNRNII
jgi:hypothetical protein